RMARAYSEALGALQVLQLPVEKEWAQNVYWMYGIVLQDDLEFDAAAFAQRLSKHGIETRPFFKGMHEQPALVERGLFRAERYPVAERLAQRGLYLPSGLTLTDAQIDRVCSAIKEVLR